MTKCFECEKEILRADGGQGAIGGYLREDKAKICKKCYENSNRTSYK